MKTYEGVDIWPHELLTSALVGGEWSASSPGRITPGEKAPGIHCIGGWMGPRIGLNDVERRKILPLLGLELRLLCRPARNQSLYRLRYPGSLYMLGEMRNTYGILVMKPEGKRLIFRGILRSGHFLSQYSLK
jgi:hypothetical protein